jgi:hypothetical protein
MPNIIYYKLKLDNTIAKSPPTPITINTPIPTNKANSFGQLVKEGVAFGTGSIVAKNVADKLLNTESSSNTSTCNTNTTNNKNKCYLLKEQFDRCIYKDIHGENNCTYIKNLYEISCKNKKD